MGVQFPAESSAYRQARERLLHSERELRRHMEAVAVERRALPPGAVVPNDYIFEEGQANGGVLQVRLSELFAPGTCALAVYHFMFPRWPTDKRPKPATGSTALLPIEESPCPSCTALLDQLDAAAFHVESRMSLVVVAKAPAQRLFALGHDRGWRQLRLLSAAGNSFPHDYNAESEEGHPQPMMNVFERQGDVIRHFWSSELFYEPADEGQDMRHLGTLEPMWNLFDLTREGRGIDWSEQFSYDCCHQR
jgi:predicted dithiol-disulfide oxidoreductase (DUF899 family)